MAKEWTRNLEIPWITNEEEDDFYAAIGDYKLRVEQMNKGHWWWRVYYKDETIPTKLNEFSNNKYRAIGLAEGLYLGHESRKLEFYNCEIKYFKSSI